MSSKHDIFITKNRNSEILSLLESLYLNLNDFKWKGILSVSNVIFNFQVIVTPMDQKLRDLRTLKQHYYPEVNIFLLKGLLVMGLAIKIEIKNKKTII